MTGGNQDVLEFLNQTKAMYDEDSTNYRMCEQAIAAVMGVQKAAMKLAYIHQCIDLYCDREELHDESYWLDYILDPEWIDTDIGWDGDKMTPNQSEFPTRCDNMKDDTISRQAAIDALSYCQTYLFDSRDEDKKISLEDAKYAIEQLPSAQPELIAQGAYVRGFEQGRTQGMLDAKLEPTCNQLATDTISRQAAIDAVVAWTVEDRPDIEMPTDLVGRIKALPSAQPDLDSAYTEGYTAAESKYRQMWDEMPKIILCRDCKHCKTRIDCIGGEYNGCEVWTGYESEVEPDWFCNFAERRTDDCK